MSRHVEADQLTRIAEIAARYGVLYHHCRDSPRCSGNPGLPDLILVGPGGALFRELKSRVGKMTIPQNNWRLTLRAGGLNAGIWLPSHVHNGLAEAEIAAIAEPRHRQP